MKRVGVIGIGHSRFGKRPEVSLREIVHEATRGSFLDASLEPKDIEASIFSLAGDMFNGQGAPGALISDYVGLSPKPVIRVESACASGSAGIKTAVGLINGGFHDLVMVIGAEKMCDLSTPLVTELMSRAGDLAWEYPFGVSFPGFYALFASRHMAEFGTTRDQLSMVGVKNHKYGYLNPLAHLRKQVTLEEAKKSIHIVYPLNLYDCSLISDGAAAMILASEEKAKQLTDDPIWITAIGSGGDHNMVADREVLTGLIGAQMASRTAYEMAGIKPQDIDVACVHDCFTIAEIMAYEDCGFCDKGEGGKFIEEGRSELDGDVAVNVDGGLKSKGHPVGATGVAMGVELTKQLRGKADTGRQRADAEIAMSHNVGQSGQFVHCIVYQR
ncbi:MAG: thiolase domain-containing protein [Promethearchaeota archaeon]